MVFPRIKSGERTAPAKRNATYIELSWFEGTFNGNSHSISNLTIQYRIGDEVRYTGGGLFEGLNHATIKNLTIRSPEVSAGEFDTKFNNSWDRGTGALAGYAWDGTFENVHIVDPNILTF